MLPYRFRFNSPIPIYPSKYISHFLIIVCVIVAMAGFMIPNFIEYFGLHRIPLFSETIPYIVGQIIFFQFLHGNILHLLMNSYFLYTAGPEVESRMSRSRFIAFFVSSTLFTALSLYIFAPNSLIIGISGFCMALLSYLWVDLSRIRHPMANQILIMLVINILIGILPGNISFVGHAAGAVWGLIWWQFRTYKR